MKKYTARKRHTKRKRRRQNRRTRRGGQTIIAALNSLGKKFGKQTQQPDNQINNPKFALQDRINTEKQMQLNDAMKNIIATFQNKPNVSYTEEQKSMYTQLNQEKTQTPTIDNIQSASKKFDKLGMSNVELKKNIENYLKLEQLRELISTPDVDIDTEIQTILNNKNLTNNIDEHIGMIQTKIIII